MKKSILSVGIFLIGISTQANVTTESKVYNPWDNYDRYLSTQSVTFYERGILFEVFLDGSFSYALPNGTYYNRRGQVTRRRGRRALPVHNRSPRRAHNLPLHLDRLGVLHGIGITNILYKPNGKVKHIGSVRMRYRQGRLISVGGMDVFYGRRGRVSHTLGHINRLNIIHGPCGIIPTNNYGHRYYGHDTRYGNNYRNAGRTGRRSQADDWNDDWDDDDDDDDRNGRRSRN